MLLRTELLLLRGLCLNAVRMALAGDPGGGLGRVMALGDAAEPCGQELIARYRQRLDEYARAYDVARE
jgi:hypothetical protein